MLAQQGKFPGMFQKLIKIVPGEIPRDVLENAPGIFEKLGKSRLTATNIRKFRGGSPLNDRANIKFM